jgi:hypothetical protein
MFRRSEHRFFVASGLLKTGAGRVPAAPVLWKRPCRGRVRGWDVYHSFGYALWSVEQEFILQSFFYVNIEKIEGNKLKSAAMATGLFAAAHLPNPLLVAATLAIGFCFTQIFRRYRNIYTLGIAHGLLGLALACSLPNDVHRHMRVDSDTCSTARIHTLRPRRFWGASRDDWELAWKC